jgi:hypothetical protein
MTSGYSGTPLPKKLGIKPEFRVALYGIPAEVNQELSTALRHCRRAKSGPFDFAMLFVTQAADLQRRFSPTARQLAPAGMLWVSWPKKVSGMASDLSENLVREIGLAAGLVDVKVCAVNETWSGLKFVIRVKDRKCREQ